MMMWLAQDPRDGRVFMQDHELTRADFPPGLAGEGWPQRVLDVDDADVARVLAGEPGDEELDALHLGWWDAAEPV